MKIILARPRGFCAGVERAIRCVERVLELYGPPVYVLNDIVHNAAVVNMLRARGVVFVRGIEEAPRGAHLLFSAHGVGPDAWAAARARDLDVVDATCPLVEKVHREAVHFAGLGYTVVLIGERGHDEVTGTAGWGRVRSATGPIRADTDSGSDGSGYKPDLRVVFSEAEVAALEVPDPAKVAYLSQTTLSVDDRARVVAALEARFPGIVGPPSEDICYATQNRQRAVKELSGRVDLVLVVGDSESGNSKRLANISAGEGKASHLISSAAMIEDSWFEGVDAVLVTSGASAPEVLVEGVIGHIRSRMPCEIEEIEVVRENVRFRLPELIE